MPTMLASSIARQCKEKGYYRTPEFNEQLYLHFAGYSRIENLEEFTGCRVLWLEHNSIEAIENLEALTALRVLHLNHNNLRDLGRCPLPQLDTLNVSHNFIADVSGLDAFPNLQKLYASNNDIDDTQLIHLYSTPNLSVLDLSRNKLSNPDRLIETLAKLQKLHSLNLAGNDVVRKLPNYRKRLIVTIPTLCHLDEMPVFANERRCAEAWQRGGRDEEKAETARIRQEDEERRVAQRQWFERFVQEAKTKPPLGETDYVRDMRAAEELRIAAEFEQKPCKSALTPRPAPASCDGDDNVEDDDDIAIGPVAAPIRPKAAAGPSGTRHHVDPFAECNTASTQEPDPSIVDPTIPVTESDVLDRLRLDEATVEGFASLVGTGAAADKTTTDELITATIEPHNPMASAYKYANALEDLD
jgi:dynein assembly factor 1